MKPLNAFTCGTVYRALLTVILTLALFAGNAAAQCKGKKVYIQLPDGWGTNVYILWNGKFERMTTTTEGAWTTFTFPTTLQNDDANSANRAEMIITDYDDYYNNAGTTHYITTRDIGSSKNLPENTASRRFSCNDFSSPATYISFNPSTPSKPNISALPPDAKYLYFLPPDAPEWVSGKSYVYNGTSTEAMEPAPGMCGWYRIVYFNRAAPATAQFYLGSSGTKKVGSLGEDGYIDLAAKFASMGNDVYFVADEEEWYPMDPGISDGSRCGYNLAAFIYDTDPSVHPDFSCGVYQDEDNCTEAPANTNKKTKCTGVRKGLVKPNLDPVTKKTEYGGVDPQGCWTSRSWFDTAFKSSPGVNVTHCFDLPFKQEQNGRFEFDSDKWLNADGSLIGGFFPEMLHNAPTDPSCPSCNTKRTAEVFTPMHEKLTVEQFDSYVSKEGDFMNGNTPELSAMLPGATENTVWDWGARDKLRWYLHGATSILGNAKSKANQHFCFESHAEFVYQKGQVFDFRGDDAIWIFIDNRLSVDLGGAHMAAPARVNLDTMGLTAGVTYPIDIFFCDMRTTQSNV
ncbi:MAG: fibro-slime domain-containing protein, partial [Fibromonadaceae bacterium]|nr:fibro-slime domain-containing protein [Fibromonadaceae bacterium]